jgi:hypothetical protein
MRLMRRGSAIRQRVERDLARLSDAYFREARLGDIGFDLERRHVRHRDDGAWESAADENGVTMSPTFAL